MRNVKKPIVAAGQVTDRGQGVWLNGDGVFKLDVKSTRKIVKLLGVKRGFVELLKQKDGQRTERSVFCVTTHARALGCGALHTAHVAHDTHAYTHAA